MLVITADFVYLRFIGDMNIQEKDFGRIQEMQKWADNIKDIQEDHRIKLAIVVANNHYAGFGPGTANIFKNMPRLSNAKWEEKEYNQHYHKKY